MVSLAQDEELFKVLYIEEDPDSPDYVYDTGRSEVVRASDAAIVAPKYSEGQEVLIKGQDKKYNVRVWVVSRQYKENGRLWEYTLCRKDPATGDWVGESLKKTKGDMKAVP